MSRKSFISAVAASVLFILTVGAAHAVLPKEAADGQTATAAALQPDTQRSHKPGELLVKFKAGVRANAARTAIRAKGRGIAEAKQFKALKHKRKKLKYPNARMDRWWRIKLEEGTDLQQAMKEIAANPAVEFVEPNYEVQVQLTPNDPRFGDLWGLHNIQQTGGLLDADVDAPEAWEIETGSQGVVVAVIDTGVDYNHEDLAANMWTNTGEIAGNGIDDDGNGFVDDVYGYDFLNNDGDPFDDHGHGTHCSGTIAGVGNNGIGVVGVNWNARIMALKFLSAGGGGSISDAVDAVIYATNNGAKIMSNSWGGGGFSQAMLDAINAANDAGVLFVAAAGNHSGNNDANPYYPATYDAPNVIAVAATDHNDAKAGFSGYGAQTVDLGAPGVSVLSSVPTGSCRMCSPSGYGYASGTSMATPHVSGAAALVLAKNPALSIADLKTILFESVDLIPALAGITVTGGRLNVASAVNFNLEFEITVTPASQSVLPGESTTYTVTVTSNSDTEQQVTLSLGSLDPGISATLTDTTLTLPALGTASTTLTVTADVSVPRGSYAVPVNGADGSGQTISGAIALLRVLVPEYNMSIDPSLRIIGNGDSTTYNVTLTSIDGYSGAVTLSATSPDPLITLGLAPSVVTVPADGSVTATLSATTDASIPNQTYTLTVDATDGSINKAATTQLRILDTDLVMSSVTHSITEIGVGESFSLSSTIANQGAEATETTTYVGYYLSTDATITTDDTLIGTEAVAAVAGNGSVPLSSAPTVPASLAEGTYYVGAIADYSDLQPETNEGNNALVAAGTIQVIREVDLVPTAFDVPAGDYYTGSTVATTGTVANQGGSPTTGGIVYVHYYLSTDAVITPDDTQLSYTYNYGMGANSTWDVSRNLPIPTNTAPGTYYLGVIVDKDNAHAETDESNNTLVAVNQIQVLHEVDLAPTVFDVPAGDYYTGSYVATTGTVANQGGSPTTGGIVYVHYYLSTDAVITPDDTQLSYTYNYGMSANGTWDVSRNLPIPTNTAPGTYYLGVIVDKDNAHAETDESNNTLVAVNQINVIHEVDLAPTVFDVPAGDYYTGSYVATTGTVANQGGSPTTGGIVYVHYYLSTDAVITPDDTQLSYTYNYGMGANGTWDVSRNLPIPTNTAPGTYYLGVIVDKDNAHGETDESNNTLVALNQINVIHEVDLTPTVFDVPAGDYYTGSYVATTGTVVNQGGSPTTGGIVYVHYYLSTDAVITPDDIQLSYTYNYGMSANGTWDVSRNLGIPTNTAPGTYYLGVIVDKDNTHAESDESNNTLVAVNQINVIHEVDLTPTVFDVPAGDYYTGSLVSTTGTVANQGGSPTTGGIVYVHYYLSTDAVITPDDTQLSYTYSYGMGANGTWDINRNFLIPNNTAPGTYYLGVIVDKDNTHAETDESNNTLVAVNQINVIHEVDLTPTAFDVTAGDYSLGSYVSTTATVANQGGSPTSGGIVYVHYYLSTDAVITPDDTQLSYAYNYVMGANGTWDVNRNLLIPSNTVPGAYYLGVLVDKDNIHAETDETNNTLAMPVNIVP